MKRPVEIAVFGSKSFPAFAGADRVAENILLHLPPDESVHYTLYVVRTPGQPKPFDVSPRLRVIPLPAMKGKHSRATSFFLLSALHGVFFLRPNLAHVHDSAFGPFTWILRLFRPRMPILGTFHGNPYERAKWSRFAKWFLRISEAAFINGCTALTTVARAKVAEVQGKSATPITFIPNGVNPNPTIPDTGRPEALGLVSGAYLMFAAGRMDPTKGLHHLLDAYDRLGLDLPLLVAGGFEGHNRDYSETLLKRCRENPHITLLPRLLGQAELFELVAHARLFIFPSEVEAMSMMLLEVISCATPLIASDIPENTEVTGEAYPWLFRNADAADLARVLSLFLTKGAGEETRDLQIRCARDFNWTAIAERYADLYQHLLAP
ncbi:MAG: glycosyltransferase family 4 protein [Verrucomicrobiota bacterium]|jgi:glycosyltransferase involved in cell wall biosynthesis|nr:glycosyltransferase family 4 protein [Verrucomicrobiota bacterium]